MNNILVCKNIHRSFKKANDIDLEIIKGVSFEIERKKTTVIVGASGAGKSTLLHILGGLDKPGTGLVEIEGKDIYKMNDENLSSFLNNKIGFVFQFHYLLPEFTASENVSIPQMINGISIKSASKRSEELLDIVGLSDRIDHKPSELSGGEQQRVAIARALANKPEIIFADEPTGNLDSANSNIIHELISKLKNEFGLTFLLVTHNQQLIKLGDRILEMKDGAVTDKI